ncbi:hypothetical protein [Sorangium sp. So ce204]|uniref:hypothetical protein n=1 Tax=Sorangium sp. So ce204 TaxID=3133288 RepID=UPI003F613EB1
MKTALEQVKAEFTELKHRVYRRESEKMPAMEREVRRGREKGPSESLRERRENALANRRSSATS